MHGIQFMIKTCIHKSGKMMICPKCGSSELEIRDHEQRLKSLGGIVLSSAGVAAGTVGGAAAGASTGAAIGTLAGPLGVITGATIGTFVGAISAGVTGGFLGRKFGNKAGTVVDKNVFFDYLCKQCGCRFNA